MRFSLSGAATLCVAALPVSNGWPDLLGLGFACVGSSRRNAYGWTTLVRKGKRGKGDVLPFDLALSLGWVSG